MDTGTALILVGIVLIIFGLAFAGKLGPLGNLPGDFTFGGERTTFYLPITTSILLSVILTLILWFILGR